MTLKRYDVEINGVATTLQLNDEDAERMGVLANAPAKKAAPKPANKARTPRNKGA